MNGLNWGDVICRFLPEVSGFHYGIIAAPINLYFENGKYSITDIYVYEFLDADDNIEAGIYFNTLKEFLYGQTKFWTDNYKIEREILPPNQFRTNLQRVKKATKYNKNPNLLESYSLYKYNCETFTSICSIRDKKYHKSRQIENILKEKKFAYTKLLYMAASHFLGINNDGSNIKKPFFADDEFYILHDKIFISI